jgi:hypothetical protein
MSANQCFFVALGLEVGTFCGQAFGAGNKQLHSWHRLIQFISFVLLSFFLETYVERIHGQACASPSSFGDAKSRALNTQGSLVFGFRQDHEELRHMQPYSFVFHLTIENPLELPWFKQA